jgi:hypothetical protein
MPFKSYKTPHYLKSIEGEYDRLGISRSHFHSQLCKNCGFVYGDHYGMEASICPTERFGSASAYKSFLGSFSETFSIYGPVFIVEEINSNINIL